MNNQLDKNLQEWLQELAKNWNASVEYTARRFGVEEIKNRLEIFPKICTALGQKDINLNELKLATRNCWALNAQQATIRFNRFHKNGIKASTAIESLIANFPADDSEAAQQIDRFVATAVELGYSNKEKSRDYSGAALLASVILTSVFPFRFVDFRLNRWYEFAKTLKHEEKPRQDSYGHMLIWAGKFAQAIVETETYGEHWPEASDSLWTIAGICWDVLHPKPVPPEPPDIEGIESFPEGREKRRLHLLRERNQTLVDKAKRLYRIQDPQMKCQVCGFSFSETYGKLGEDFIEAHHKQPIATLQVGSRTKIEDLAFLCANCHRMIHRGDRSLSIRELKNITVMRTAE